MRSLSHRRLLAALTVVSLSGCIREKLPPCPAPFRLCIRVAPPEPGGELPDAAVDTATVFLFDGQGILREIRGVGRAALANGDPVEFPSCGTCRPHVVVWGNLKNTDITPPVAGETTFDGMRLSMRTCGEFACPPDNLYFGTRERTADCQPCIRISPAMGRLTVTARGLERQADERYFFRVETAIGSYDFRRTPLRQRGVLRLDASRRETTGDLTSGEAVPLFVYPEEHERLEPLHVSLYRVREDGAQLVGETDLDDKLLEIIPRAGQCVHVMMDFQTAAGVRVDIRITPWDVVELWEDW